MKKGLGVLGVAGKTPFAYVGQRSLTLFDEHPTIEVRALVADDPADVGKTLAEAVEGRWLLDEPVPEHWQGIRLVGATKGELEGAGVDFVLSALPGPHARQADPALAALGFPVVSESAGLRMDADVPLLVPDINADHLGILSAQKQARGYDRGFLVACPLCTAVIYAITLRPLIERFGVDRSVVTTMQALSGAGRTGVPALDVVDNILPLIPDEEEKLYAETAKILGSYANGRIEPWAAPISATCTRVPVRDGHTAAATVQLGRKAGLDEVQEAMAGYRGRAQELALATAPAEPMALSGRKNRPQPLFDRDADAGRQITLGRFREAASFENGISYVAVGHNHNRGTVGNAAIVCDLLVAEGLV